MEFERDWRRLFWGILLILLGTIFMLDRFAGLPDWVRLFQWWPLIVIALGLVRLVAPRRARDVGNGVLFILLGGWFWVASNDWHGLDWHNSWPLALVAVGAGTVAKALAARWLPDRRWTLKQEEEHHA